MFVWDVDPVLLRFGPVQVRYYGVFFGLTLLGGFLLWRWQMLRAGRSEEQAQRFLLLGVVGVVIGSKLGHVLFYRPGTLLHDPLEVLAFWKGGLSSHGATVGLIAALTYFARREKMRFADVADRLALSIAWGATLVRVGNFFNSEIVGRVAGVPWSVKFPRHDLGLPLDRVPWRHPSQLYEVAIGLFVLFTLYAVDRRFGEERPVGLLGFLFVCLYFPLRFLVEFVKEYQALEASSSPLTMGQYLSIPAVAFGVWGLWRALKHPVPASALAPGAVGTGGRVGKGRETGRRRRR